MRTFGQRLESVNEDGETIIPVRFIMPLWGDVMGSERWRRHLHEYELEHGKLDSRSDEYHDLFLRFYESEQYFSRDLLAVYNRLCRKHSRLLFDFEVWNAMAEYVNTRAGTNPALWTPKTWIRREQEIEHDYLRPLEMIITQASAVIDGLGPKPIT